MKTNKKIAIIGGGILGLSVAYKLTLNNFHVHVFEKESEIGSHQSGRNSGVLHCGLYYQPGSLKAKLAVNGIKEMTSFCNKYQINHDICGKVVVATNDRESKDLQELAKRGTKNGLKGLKYLDKSELKRREPYVIAKKALLVPGEGIVDYKAVMLKLVQLIKERGGKLSYNNSVKKIVTESRNLVSIENENSTYNFDYIVSCSGLWSDVTYKNLTLSKPSVKIIPFRGEYFKFKSSYKNRVNHLIYPVPNSKYPFLGVHFTRTVNGDREVGPNAVLALKREGYSRASFSLKDAFQTLTYPGLVRFIYKNFSFSVNEFKSSLFKKDFVKKAQRIIPEIDSSMLESGITGVRAQAISSDGELEMDFNIIRKGRQVHILNAPSPGATASLAIASHIIKKYIT